MSLFVTLPDTGDSLSGAVGWLLALLLGSIGTTVAIVAIASVGLLMLSGRVPVRRGATVVVGCFILFSAVTIANGLMSGGRLASAELAPPAPPPPAYEPATSKPEPYDPYAGAAVPDRSRHDLFK